MLFGPFHRLPKLQGNYRAAAVRHSLHLAGIIATQFPREGAGWRFDDVLPV